jgi:hypothetical protein
MREAPIMEVIDAAVEEPGVRGGLAGRMIWFAAVSVSVPGASA